GNVIQAQPGASGYLFQVDPSVMIERFCKFDFRNFPNVCNFVFSKSLANEIIEETGRFFWPMAPDYSATLLLMCKTQKPYFFDEYCCFGGRSLKSNYHSILVRQKNGRMDDFINEFDDSVDKMPFHSPQLPSYWNHLIAPVAIARQLYPNEMGEFDISRSEFVKRIYSEIYSTMERLPHWEDERLIDAWRGYFRKAGVSNYELDKVASDASIANQPLEKEQIKPSSINMLQLESLQIQSLVQLMKQFDKVLPFLRRRVSQEFSIMKNRAFKFVKEME
ncbi:hypothetical protein, partial [Paraglaciecola sp.]|uniref:hypothetical protein n=1 Tax=Paraglaciecola sp. TaxID=1920173 RepID=UPI003EF0ED74